MKRLLSLAFALVGLFALTGCDLSISNLTPDSLPENPSRIYTLTARVTPAAGNIVKDSLAVHIVVDGQIIPLSESSLAKGIYEYDYKLPAGINEISYYFLAAFDIRHSDGSTYHAERYTELQHTKITSRYVVSLQASRGPVGAYIGIVGRGFGKNDVVLFDNTPVRTQFESSNALGFYVPAVAAGQNYSVSVQGPQGTTSVGTFRVDAAKVTVSPESLELKKGASQSLTFTLPERAPLGGLLLDVTTDQPDCVIMPEVNIPEGQTSVTVPVTGGKIGSGNLFLSGYGDSEITVPFTVAK